jgi:hypothetical protein
MALDLDSLDLPTVPKKQKIRGFSVPTDDDDDDVFCLFLQKEKAMRRAYARLCLMGDPSQDDAPAAFRLGAAIKVRYLQTFKANATLARHPCQTAAAHLPCTRPPDRWTCLGFKNDSMVSALDCIASVNASASQLSHVHPMTVQDVYALVTLMGLYLSEASGHQKAYKELLAHIDDGHSITLDEVQHQIIRFSRSHAPRVFALTHAGDSSVATTSSLVAVTHVARCLVLRARVRPLARTPPAAPSALVALATVFPVNSF